MEIRSTNTVVLSSQCVDSKQEIWISWQVYTFKMDNYGETGRTDLDAVLKQIQTQLIVAFLLNSIFITLCIVLFIYTVKLQRRLMIAYEKKKKDNKPCSTHKNSAFFSPTPDLKAIVYPGQEKLGAQENQAHSLPVEAHTSQRSSLEHSSLSVAGLRRQHPMNYEPVNYKNTPKMKAKHDRLKGKKDETPGNEVSAEHVQRSFATSPSSLEHPPGFSFARNPHVAFKQKNDGVAVTPNPGVEGQRENTAMSRSQNTTNISLKVDLHTDPMANRIINDRVYYIPPLELMGSQAVGEQAQRDYGEIQTTDEAP